MTHEEVYEEMAKERGAVTTWWRSRLWEMRRAVLKSTKPFPLTKWVDYTSARRNRYLFYTCIFDKRMKKILTGTIVTRLMPDGLWAYSAWLGDQDLVTKTVLSPHAMKRYAERAHIPEQGTELIKHYFVNNPYGCDTTNQQIIGKSVRYNGEEHSATCIKEGVLLGQLYGDLYVARTFITYEMATGMQKEEFEALRSRVMKVDIEAYHKAFEHYRAKRYAGM